MTSFVGGGQLCGEAARQRAPSVIALEADARNIRATETIDNGHVVGEAGRGADGLSQPRPS
jgi:hypothetical protein